MSNFEPRSQKVDHEFRGSSPLWSCESGPGVKRVHLVPNPLKALGSTGSNYGLGGVGLSRRVPEACRSSGPVRDIYIYTYIYIYIYIYICS